MDKAALLPHLETLARRDGREILSGLEERKVKELEFHNQDRDSHLNKQLPKDTFEALHANSRYYRTIRKSKSYIEEWIRSRAPGRIFLDYACGNGYYALKAARAGAALAMGLDISDVSVGNARQLAQSEGLTENTFYFQGDCENTGLPDGCVDACICSGMLHHLDLSYAFSELRRILAPGGVVLAWEALGYNPLIKLYRRMTPQMRTDWEKSHILNFADLVFARRFFDVREVRHWHLFGIAGAFAPRLMPLLDFMDDAALRVPGLRRMSWMFTFELHKKS